MPPVTPRQIEVLVCIHAHSVARGFVPTSRELAQLLAPAGAKPMSTNSIACFYRALQKKGLLEVIPYLARGVRLTAAGLTAIGVMPVAQRVAEARACLRVA